MYSLIHLFDAIYNWITGVNGAKDLRRLQNDQLNLNSMTDDLVAAFKSEYKERGNCDTLYQVPYLSKLAQRYQEKNDWASLLRAHTLYNSCAARSPADSAKWLEKAYRTQLKYWGLLLQSYSQHMQVAAALKSELKAIREQGSTQINRIREHFQGLTCSADVITDAVNQEAYKRIIQDMPVISNSINQDMINFTRFIIERATAICGVPPAPHCVVALGSMARRETTPYSDLEFLFLIESKSDGIMMYFQRLAVTIYFLIGNLRETKLKVMAISELMTWDNSKKKFVGHWFDDSGMSGFKIDGLGSWAGNIPTGGTSEQKNQFICTPAELAETYKAVLDKPDSHQSLSGDLTAMLANTAFISGKQSLHDNFRSSIMSYQPNEQRIQANIRMLIRDAKKFNFSPDLDLTHTRQLKIDVYRYPSILILNLKILHGIQVNDPWQIINQLETMKIICHQTSQCLRFSFCCALYIRLSAYFYHNSQNENISVLGSVPSNNRSTDSWYVHPELLVHMFVHLGPLQRAVTKSAGIPSKMITADLSKKCTNEMVALVKYYCHEYAQVTSLLKAEYPDGLDLAETFYQQIYIYSAIECDEYRETENLLMKRIKSNGYDDYDFCLLGRLYRRICLFPHALDAYRIRLAILISLHDFTDSEEIAWSYSQVGIVLHDLSRYAEALIEYKKSLGIRLRLYGDTDNANIATVLCNIATALQYQSKHEEALEELQKCLKMLKKVHGDRDYTQIASVLYNIGSVFQDQSKYKEALEEYSKCLDMRLRLYGNADHAGIADVLNNIGIIHHRQSEYKAALANYNKALAMRLRMCAGRDQVQIADLLCNIGNVCADQSRFTEAQKCYTECLQMRLRIFGSTNNEQVADAICNIGNVLFHQGEYDEALVKYKSCLDIYRLVHGESNHTMVADIHCNIGVIMKNQAKYLWQDLKLSGLLKY